MIISNLPDNQDRLPAYAGYRSGRGYADWLNTRIPALSMLAYLVYWPASMISDFPDAPYRDGGGALAESAVKGANPRSKTYGNAASGGPRKDYGYRGGRSRSPVAAQSVVTVYPGAYQTPAYPNSSAVDSPSNTGHGLTGVSAYDSCCVLPPQSQTKNSRWLAFQPVSGQITRITLKFDWSASGFISINAPEEGTGYAGATAYFATYYSTDNGSNFAYIYEASKGESNGVYGPGGDYRSFNDSGSFSVNLPANTPINQIVVEDQLYSSADAYGAGSESASSQVYGTISNIRLEVEVADTTAPAITGVSSSAVTHNSATISWTTNENSDSQVDYGTTAAYGQSTALNPSLVTAHSQSLSGLAANTLYHYRVKSKDAAGNLAVSGDFTFTTLTGNAAAFVSQSVPATMTAGEAYPVTVTMLNQGTITWTPGQSYRLGSQNPQDNTTWMTTTNRVGLLPGDSVSPGATTTFSFVVTAPSSPGSYNFQWRMVQDGVEWFGAMTPNIAVQVVPRVDQAQFVSQSVPSVMTRQSAYSVSVTMMNTGNTTWDSNYRLGSQNPENNTTWGLGRVYLASGETIPPGGSKTFTFTVTAPASPGSYALFQWRMVHELVQWFGDYSSGVVVALSPGNLSMALIDPFNRIGGSPGEDLLSRNYNWSLPLLSLPGRAGLDLGLALSLNSLVYTRAGSDIYFDPHQGDPGPGFTLGFPVIRNAFFNTEANAQSYLLTMPSGRRVEFRQTNTNVYDAVDSSYMRLTHDPINSVFILYTTDGTQCRFVDVTGSGDYKCVQIKDRNGNFITIGYGSLAEIRTITETLGRVINFNYDVSNHLLSITQNWGGQTHTWATFAYETQTIQTNFPGYTLNGTANGTPESVLTRVGLADGSVYSFEYNTYCQVKTVRRYAPNNSNPVNFPGDYFQRAYTTYGLPDNASSPQTDCPRITSRTDWAYDWNPGPPVTYTPDPGYAWGQVEFPDGTIYKEFFETTGWQRGLTTRTENWSGGVMRKWTTLQWTQDNTGVSYRLNPRVTETNVYDDANNRRRTEMIYTNFGLVSDVKEYDADATTVLRLTHTDYNLSAVYTDRRIIGLPSASYLKDGNNTIFSKVTYEYDLNPNPNPYLQHPGPTAQHDTANYGSGFVQGRGNLNRKLRWDVTAPTNESMASKYETGYNTSGSVIFMRDPLNHEATVSYTDSFSDLQNRNTYAYPTTMTVTDPGTISSSVQYNYDFGAVTQTKDPKLAEVTRTYDAAGRIELITNVVNGAYTRYVYSADQRQVETFTTINDLNPANEFRSVTVFDGRDRVVRAASDHPTSAGQYKAQKYVYDAMGRLAQQTNPTEVNSSWEPAGDDAAAGWVWSYQSYNWQGLPTVSTNQDETTKEIFYGGCGCAGGQVVVTRDEVGRRQKMTYDILGRLKTTQVLFIQPKNQPLDGNGTVYSTTTNTYNVRDQVTNVNVRDDASGVSQNTQMVYDGYGRLKERWLPIYLGNPQSATPFDSYEYYSDDTLMRVTDPRGASATYGYNNRHLMTSIEYGAPGGVTATPTVTFDYDNTGNRTWMDDGPGYVSYVYDTLSRLQSETRHFDELTGDYQISYTYNLARQISTITDNRSNKMATYTYNKAGELTGIGGNGYGSSAQNNFTASSASIWYRAWGGVKQLNYGNGLQLNLNYNERLQPAQYRLQTGQSQVWDGSDYQYYDDGRVKFASNMAAWGSLNPANSWDRAYNYDHVGRLSEALSGPEARGEALPAPPASPNSPYKQVNYYDVWGNLIGRANRFWRVHPSVGGVYSNNRNQAWSYDTAGNILIEAVINSYDVSGRNVLSRSNLYIVGGGQTGNPQLSAFEIAQSYDGDMAPAKRIETRRTEELIDGGPQTEISTVVTTTYYVSSSALGGQVVLEIESSVGPNLNNITNKSYIYAGNKRIAEDNNLYTGGPSYIAWKHSNPVTGTLLKSNESGVFDRTELDPFGAIVGNSDPYFDIPDGVTYFDLNGQKPLYIESGDPFNLTSGCSLDGMPVACDIVKNSWGTGNEEAMAVVPDGVGKQFINGRWEYFTAFADGRQGYLPFGAIVKPEGGWYDPNSRTEGRVGSSLGFGMGQFQHKKGIQKKKPQVPTPVDPKLKSPCYGKSASDLDYDHVNTYDEGKTVITETGKEHILRNHTVPTQISVGWAGPKKLEMLAGYLKKSLYGSNEYITGSELFDNIRLVNSATFDFGNLTMQTHPTTGQLTAFVFQHRFLPAVSLSGSYVNFGYIGAEYNSATKTVSSSQYNTLILDPDCKTVRTSFPGRLP